MGDRCFLGLKSAALCEGADDGVECFGARSRVAFGRPGAGVAEEVTEREAVDAFACERAGEGVALVVEAETAVRRLSSTLGRFLCSR
jgi:hypothetical protein